MKQPTKQLLVSKKFLDQLINRIVWSFPHELAQELVAIVTTVTAGEDATQLYLQSSELARQIYKFMCPEVVKAVERSRRCREAAARRKERRADAQARTTRQLPTRALPAMPSSTPLHVERRSEESAMTRQMRRKLARQLAKSSPPSRSVS